MLIRSLLMIIIFKKCDKNDHHRGRVLLNITMTAGPAQQQILFSYWASLRSAAPLRNHVRLRVFQDQDGSLRVSVLRGESVIPVIYIDPYSGCTFK